VTIISITRGDKAVASFMEGFTCSQAVVLSFAHDYKIKQDEALKLTAGLGDGIARSSHTCGVVDGAYIIIGLKNGLTPAQIGSADKNTFGEKTNQMMQAFNEKFTALNQSLDCRGLLNFDISTPAGLEDARQNSLFKTICPKIIRDAVDILEGM
jgi:C_GCAxxG_C_C family probable redox protein